MVFDLDKAMAKVKSKSESRRVHLTDFERWASLYFNGRISVSQMRCAHESVTFGPRTGTRCKTCLVDKNSPVVAELEAARQVWEYKQTMIKDLRKELVNVRHNQDQMIDQLKYRSRLRKLLKEHDILLSRIEMNLPNWNRLDKKRLALYVRSFRTGVQEIVEAIPPMPDGAEDI